MTRRIECDQTLGTPYDAEHLTVTVDGGPLPLDTRVNFTRVRDTDPATGKPTGPLLTGILLSGEPQYDVEVFADGVLVASIAPRSEETDHVYARLAEVEAEEARRTAAVSRRRRP